MRSAGTLSTILMAALVTACAVEQATVASEPDDVAFPDDDDGCNWEFGCNEENGGDEGEGDKGGDDKGSGDDGGGGGTDNGSGGTGDGGGTDDGGGGTCDGGATCGGGDDSGGGDNGGGGTCDHNGDGHCDQHDCDHDDDGDCDEDEGDGHDDGDCMLTQGYWKNHAEDWPLTSLALGANVYTQAELLEIFHTPVATDGLIALAHQLIAAKLNVALGGSATGIADLIADADALIGSLVVGVDALHSSVTSDLTNALDAFNNGRADGAVCY